MLLVLLILFSRLQLAYSAYCGTSTIPYSLEVLNDGTFTLGCARPTCFGWDGASGNWATQDQLFLMENGQMDGFLRNVSTQRAPFNYNDPSVKPQTATCYPGYSCRADQWAGGLIPARDGIPASLFCCNYPPLETSEFRGVATVTTGQIYNGGEVQTNGHVTHFDYIRNIDHIKGPNDEVMGYSVEVGRMECTDPPAIATPRRCKRQFDGGSNCGGGYYYPVQDSGFFCFAGDSRVTLGNGEEKRMDELKIDDWVMIPTDDMTNVTMRPVNSWLHRIPEQEADFLVITTDSGKELKVTESHYVYKRECHNNKTNDVELVPAREVDVGDCVFELDHRNLLRINKVTAIRSVFQKGIFAPLTAGGKIIVDGVAASCHSEVTDNSIVLSMHKHFVHCDEDDLTCRLKDSVLSLALDMAQLILPSKS